MRLASYALWDKPGIRTSAVQDLEMAVCIMQLYIVKAIGVRCVQWLPAWNAASLTVTWLTRLLRFQKSLEL
jgi:hypothetical protein